MESNTRKAIACCFEEKDDSVILSNALCRILWSRTPEGWSAQFQLKAEDVWHTLALDGQPGGAPYEAVEQRYDPDDNIYGVGEFRDKFRAALSWRSGRLGQGLPVRIYKGFPPVTSRPKVDRLSPQEIQITWQFPLTDGDKKAWQIEASFRMTSGAYHVQETVRFTRLIDGEPVRLRRVWHIMGIPPELISSSIKSVTQLAWHLPYGTFMALATHDGLWTPFSGGGGMVNLTLGQEFQQFIDGKCQTSPDQAFVHQAPPCMEREGWLELRAGDSYVLKHFHIMHPTYPFKRSFINYMHRLQPMEYLHPRYPWRYFIDKCLWALRYTPCGFEDGGEWGHYWKDWYNLTEDPACGQTGLDKVQSLDWGASWDIWSAYFLLLYGQKYSDDWCMERYQKIRNGIVMNKWQVEAPGSLADGAFWMERDQWGNFHISNWMAKDNPRTLWVCDAAKIGYFLCLLYEKTNDQVLLDKAKRAAEFLLRVQKENGDLQGSVFTEDGQVAWPSNLGGTVSPLLVWSKLYQITGDKRYISAACKAADYAHATWLSNDQWQLHGGEIDSFGYPDSTTSMYATMGFAALAIATNEEKHRQMTADAANHLVAQQWLFDINYGYYRKEARWNGTDAKTVGALQGWIRPECTMSMYMAWKATGDPLYRYSMEQHTAWMTYMQYDNPDSPKTYGGGHEVLEIPADHMNGFGSNFWPETVGQAVAVMELMNDDDGNERTTPDLENNLEQ